MQTIFDAIEWQNKKNSYSICHQSTSTKTSFADIVMAKKERPMSDFMKKHQKLHRFNHKTSMQEKRQFIRRTREIELMLAEQRLPSIHNELERLRLIGELRYLQSIK